MSVPTHTPTLIFGREPAAWTAAIMSAVALVVAFGVNVSTETQGIIQAFVNAVLSLIVVITVRETVLPAIVGVIGTGLPLLVAFGFDLTDQQQGAILAAAPLVLGLLVTRPQVTPTVNVPAVTTPSIGVTYARHSHSAADAAGRAESAREAAAESDRSDG